MTQKQKVFTVQLPIIFFLILMIIKPWIYRKKSNVIILCCSIVLLIKLSFAAWKVSKYGVSSDSYFPVFGLSTKYCRIISVFSPNAGRNGRKTFRSSCPEAFCKKGVLRNFAKFTGKHLCHSFFCRKVAKVATLFKKETMAQVFSCEFCEISKNTFSYRTPLVAASEPLIWTFFTQYFLSFFSHIFQLPFILSPWFSFSLSS